MRIRNYNNFTKTSLALAVASFCTPAANAQSAEPATPKKEQVIEEVQVTGSRIARRDDVSSSPIVTATQATIEATGQVNLEQALQQMPQFLGGRDSTMTGLGGNGYATLNLRGLGDNRNLVLLDGHRLPIATSTGATDINILPQSLVGSVEVISGGASAVYGSDAISGVVNFKSRQLDGVEVSTQRNQSEHGDAGVWNASISAGGRFADDRGQFFVTGNFTEREILYYKDREFFERAGASGSQATGAVQLSGGAPSAAAVNSVFGSYGIAPGTVSPTSRFGFNDDGTLYAVTGGHNFRESLTDYGLVGGQIVGLTTRENYLVTPQDRYNVYGKASFDLTPGLEVYGHVLYTESTVTTAGAWAITAPSQLSLPVTNPFIPADLRTLLASRPANAVNNPVLLFKGFKEVGRRTYDEDFDVYQVGGGVKGHLAGDWTFDVFASTDDTTLHERINHVVLAPRVQRLLNAPDGGNSICAGGYNPFGEAASATISQACIDYLTAPTDTKIGLEQSLVEATAQGSVFELPTGTVKASVTAGWRENQFELQPDILLIPNYDYTGTQFNDIANARYPNSPAAATNAIIPANGKVSVKEIAGEVRIPIAADMPFAKAANLTLGVRESDYNLAGSAFTYKAEIDWRPVNSLLVRGGFEHAIRAPNVAELFSQNGTVVSLGNAPNAGDPCDSRSALRNGPNAARIRDLCLAQFQAVGLTADQAASIYTGYTYPSSVVGSTIFGNDELQPENADTLTFGVVLSPDFEWDRMRRATLSLDYYDIAIDEQISTMSGSTTLQKCFNLDGSNPNYNPASEYCSTIVRSPGSAILFNIGAPYQNLGGTKTSGLDAQLDTEFDLTDRVSLGFNVVFNYLLEYDVQALIGSPWQQYKGTVSSERGSIPPLPEWRSLSTLSLMVGEMSAALRWRHIESMEDVASVTSPTPPPGVPSYDIFDLSLRARIGLKLEISAGVNNLFDKQPLLVGNVSGQTNTTLYDPIGRSFFLGAKVQL